MYARGVLLLSLCSIISAYCFPRCLGDLYLRRNTWIYPFYINASPSYAYLTIDSNLGLQQIILMICCYKNNWLSYSMTEGCNTFLTCFIFWLCTIYPTKKCCRIYISFENVTSSIPKSWLSFSNLDCDQIRCLKYFY